MRNAERKSRISQQRTKSVKQSAERDDIRFTGTKLMTSCNADPYNWKLY